jgi:WD40 repeat protein
VRLWNLKRLTPQPTEPAGPEHPVTAIVATGRDGEQDRCLVTGHRNGMLQRHDLATGERIGDPVCKHPSPIQMMAEVPVPGARPRVATIDNDNTVRLWDLGSPTQPVPPQVPAPPELVAELPSLDARAIVAVERGDDTLVAVGGGTGMVRLWGVRNGGSPGSSPLTPAHTGAVTSMLFGRLSDGTPWLVTAGSDHMIRAWTVRRDDTLTYLTADTPAVELSSAVTAMAIVPTEHGLVVAAGGDDGSVRLLDTADGRVLTTMYVGGDAAPVAGLRSVQAVDGRWLLLGIGRMGALYLWGPDTGHHVHRLRLDGPIEASHAFGSNLAIATRRGLSLLTLTFAGPEGISSDTGRSGVGLQGQQGGGWS